MKRFTSLLLILVLALLLFSGCSEKSSIDSEFLLSETKLSLLQGDSAQLIVQEAVDQEEPYSVSWSSDTTSVAVVDTEGTVTALAVGSAVVSAKIVRGKSTATLTCDVTVTENTNVLTGLSFSANLYSMGADQTLNLQNELIFSPANAADKTITWSSSNSAYANVVDGIVTPVGEGAVEITATSANGISATCFVRISAVSIEATSLELPSPEYSLGVGQILTVVPTVYPENATGYSILWTSSNPNIATVSGGIITGIATGSCTITAKIDNSTVPSVSCEVTVSNQAIVVKATNVTLSPSSFSIYSNDFSTYKFTASVTPANCTENAVWTVNRPDIITIDETTGAFALTGDIGSAKSVYVIITCTVGEVYRQGILTITKPTSSISLNQTSLSLMTAGPKTSYKLIATDPIAVEPPEVIWSTSDQNVATVAKDGTVTATGAGTCTIIATSGTYSASCQVTVVKPSFLTTTVGKTVTLDATKIPADATNWAFDETYIDFDVKTYTATAKKTTGEGTTAIRCTSAADPAKTVTFDIYIGN